MNISLKSKRWLEDNAAWLDELNLNDGRDLEKVFNKIPGNLFNEIYQLFKTAGIELLDNNLGNMYGIKSSDGYITLSLGKHNKTNFNINFTASEGMRGGHQIGFKSISDAIDFIENINNTFGVDQDLRPSKMQPKTVSQYNWIEVDTVYGRCMVTDVAFDKYDPTHAANNRLIKRAKTKVFNEEYKWIQNNIDFQAIKNYLIPKFEDQRKIFTPAVMIESYNYKCCIWLKFISCIRSEIFEIIKYLEQITGIKFILMGTIDLNKMYHILIRPDNPEFNQIEPDIYAKYGI